MFEELKSIFSEMDALAQKADEWNTRRAAIADPARADALWDEYRRQSEEDERNTARASALAINAEYIIRRDVIPAALAIWNAYEGKRIGEKTHEKIRAEARKLADDSGLDYVIFYERYLEVRHRRKCKTYYDFDGTPNGHGAKYYTIDCR